MKNCIAALTRGYIDLNDYEVLIRRNISIYENIYKNSENEYDIILFHEGNITLEHQSFIQLRTKSLPIIFIDVSKEFDKYHLNLNNMKGKYSKTTPINSGATFGYKCMCRFWAYGFINYTKNYNYVIRIDEDCIIYNFPNDICKNLKSKNIYFYTGLLLHNFDDGDCKYGIEEFTKEFVNDNNINLPIDFGCVPYTNFCIIDVEYFNDCELFINWKKAIENEGGIFISRWGDANLWGIYLYLSGIINTNFIEDKNIKYFHGTHNQIIN